MSDEIQVHTRKGGKLWDSVLRATKEASGLQTQFTFTPISLATRELEGTENIDITKLERKLRSAIAANAKGSPPDRAPPAPPAPFSGQDRGRRRPLL